MASFVDAEDRAVGVLEGNPAYRDIYLSVIDRCRRVQDEEDVLSMCDDLRTSKSQVQSASGIVSALVNCGALARTVLVDGEPYDGSVEDFQQDDGIPEGTEARFLLQATKAGEEAAVRVSESLSLENLAASCLHRTPAFHLVLALCAEAAGKTTSALQGTLKRENMLETDPVRGIDGLHASYFTGALEHSGALAWNGGRWITSEKGLAILDRA